MTLRPYERILSAADVRDTANALGSYFFTPSTMRFFQSRILRGHWTISDDRGLFVTSERYGDNPRHYTVREYEITRAPRESDGRVVDTIDISTPLDDHYVSPAAAKTAAAELCERLVREGDRA